MNLAKDKLIVALDMDSVQRARELISALRDDVGMFKVGSQLLLQSAQLLFARS